MILPGQLGPRHRVFWGAFPFLAGPSFPGSAWERTAGEALPRVAWPAKIATSSEGREAEPPGQCVPRQSLGTRFLGCPNCGTLDRHLLAVDDAVVFSILIALNSRHFSEAISKVRSAG